jgi:hypothetical protein
MLGELASERWWLQRDSSAFVHSTFAGFSSLCGRPNRQGPRAYAAVAEREAGSLSGGTSICRIRADAPPCVP